MNKCTRLYGWLALLGCATFSIWARAQYGTEGAALKATLQYANQTIDVDLTVDFSHKFSTEFGTIRLPLQSLKTLRLTPEPSPDVLVGQFGSRWLVSGTADLVRRILDEQDEPVGLQPFLSDSLPRSISLTYQGPRPDVPLAYPATLIQTLQGQLLQVFWGDDLFELAGESGVQEVPLSRIERIVFSHRVDEAQPTAQVYWENEFGQEGTVMARQLKVRDRFGNRFGCPVSMLSQLYLKPIDKDATLNLTSPHAVSLQLVGNLSSRCGCFPRYFP